jgi:transposase
VATALGVSRFTVYNYLNRENAERSAEPRGDGG